MNWDEVLTVAPAVEVVNLTKEELDTLAKKTKLIINGVGPYHKYSTPIVEACANNGTHYVDVTGETPWYADLITKFHDKAKASGAIVSNIKSRAASLTYIQSWSWNGD